MTDAARVTELIKKIAADEALRNRLTAASDAERVQIITSMGYGDIRPADVAASAAQFVPEVAGDLDDAELANVTGGADTITTTTTTTTVTASASAAVAT
jgi:predicted ribosomally synthesized peptide with nif11-like leader